MTAALAAWLVVEILMLVVAPALGHDEAQYAVAARGDRQWLYASIGTAKIGQIGIALGGGDVAMRVAPGILSLGFVLACCWVGRIAFDARVGAWAAAAIVGAHPVALRSTELLSDLPSAACLLFGIGMLVRELSRDDGPSWWVVAVAPAFAAAFYIRYGHAPVIALAALAAAVLWWRAVVARPVRVAVTLLAFIVMLVPHAAYARHETGSVFGILMLGEALPATTRVAGGLIDYATSNPFVMYGAVIAPLVVAGLIALVRPPARWRPSILFGVIALGQFVIVGVTGTAQPRYVCVAVALLVAMAIDGILRLWPGKRIQRIGLGVFAAAWLSVAIVAIPVNRGHARLRAPLVAAAHAIAADSAGKPCLITGIEVTLLVWQTGCRDLLPLAPYEPGPPDELHYVVSQDARPIDVHAIEAARHETALVVRVAAASVHVWRLAP